jgi:SAM-dependent methyltransferase
MDTITTIPNLPFFCGIREKESTLPATLPFTLAVEDDLIIQAPNKVVSEALDNAYQEDDVFLTTPMDESPLTRWRGDEFISFITSPVKGKKILDIGCSTGYILHELAQKGGKACGIEPGPSAETAQERYGIPVKRELFKAGIYKKEFDIVLLLTVLEHIPRPAIFLKEVATAMKKDGILYIGVPSCEQQLRKGDPGMMLHEHWNYFTEQSLKNTLAKAGFRVIATHISQKGVLYASATYTGITPPNTSAQSLEIAREYAQQVDRMTRNVKAWASVSQKKAIYGASVGTAYFLTHISHSNLHIYDGETKKRGKYLPGCTIPIQPPEDIMTDNPSTILVTPINFEKTIIDNLTTNIKTGAKIIPLSTL